MPETTTQTLFTPGSTPGTNVLGSSPLAGSPGMDISQNEKDAILRQIHPIFLTTHSEEKAPVQQSNFDKFLGFMRLCLEGMLKFVDIVVDAVIQVARLVVWVVAITGVLIVVTLMTNTTDAFIDLLNVSVFKAFGWETRIQKVSPTPIAIPGTTQTTGSAIKSDSINNNTTQTTDTNGVVDTATTTSNSRKRHLITSPDTTNPDNTANDITATDNTNTSPDLIEGTPTGQ